MATSTLYTLTSTLQVTTADSSGLTNPSINYSTKLVTSQANVSPTLQRFTVGTTGVQISMSNQLAFGGALPYVLPAGGSIPRLRLINTSGQVSVAVRMGNFLTMNPSGGPSVNATQLFLGPGFVQDICLQQIGNTPTIVLVPCEAGYLNAVPCSDASPAVVDALFL